MNTNPTRGALLMTASGRRRYAPLSWTIVFWASALSLGVQRRARMTSTEYFAFLAMTGIVLGPYLIYEAKGSFAKVLGWALTVPSGIVLCYFASTFISFRFSVSSDYTRALQIAAIVCQLLVLLVLFPLLFPGQFRRRKTQRLSSVLPKVTDEIQSDKPINAVASKEEKIFIDLTPEQLIAFYADNTSIQADRLVAPSIGKWMSLSGRLSEVISSYPGFAQLTFTRRGLGSQVFMYFRDQTLIDRLSMLNRRTQMTVHGKIEKVDMFAVHLGNCELVEVES
jgi:hypothetical protein